MQQMIATLLCHRLYNQTCYLDQFAEYYDRKTDRDTQSLTRKTQRLAGSVLDEYPMEIAHQEVVLESKLDMPRIQQLDHQSRHLLRPVLMKQLVQENYSDRSQLTLLRCRGQAKCSLHLIHITHIRSNFYLIRNAVSM
jgi:hypothetical protein